MTRRHPLIAAMALLVAVPASAGFPLSTDDAGTLGAGHSKIELTGERDDDKARGVRETSLTQEMALIHGLTENLNGFFAVPRQDVRTEATGSSSRVGGTGDIKIGMKWRYYTQKELSLALKAAITSATGDATKGLGAGRSTQAVNAIASYETGPWEFDLDLGYKHNSNKRNQRQQLGAASVAVVRSLDERWNVMADIGAASNKDRSSARSPAYLGAGLSFMVTKDFSLNFGVKFGLTSVETDFTALAGLSLRF